MRPFEELIKEIEHNGEKFVPIMEILKLSIDGEYSLIQLRYAKGSDLIRIYYTDTTLKKRFEIFRNYTMWTYDYALNTIQPCSNQLQIFQKLCEWGFVEMPKPKEG